MRPPTAAARRPVRSEAGVWIDHRKAVIAILAGASEEMREVTSNLTKDIRHSGGGPEDCAEDQQDRRFAGHLNRYYDEVITQVRNAASILILGPGEAKIELAARLGNEGLRERVVGIETADKMTDPQVAARIRQRFLKSRRRPRRRISGSSARKTVGRVSRPEGRLRKAAPADAAATGAAPLKGATDQ
jgi:hypothetical protein